MENLALGQMDAGLAASWMPLAGEPLEAGLLGCAWQPHWQDGEEAEETLELSLRGSLAEVRAVLARLQGLISAHEEWEAGRAGRRLWLRARLQDGSAYAYSPILSTELRGEAPLRAGMLRGAFTLQVKLRRINSFFGEPALAGLANHLRSSSGGNLALDNHTDASHANYCDVQLGGLESELALPLRVQLRNTGSKAWGELRLGLLNSKGNMPALSLQAEDGQGGSLVNSSPASGGAYRELRLSGYAWTDLLTITLSSQQLANLGAKAYQPSLRLVTPLNAPCWLRLSLRGAGPGLWRGAETRLEAGASRAVLPALKLPPALPAAGSLPQALQLVLEGLAGEGAERVLALDDLQLLPAEDLIWVDLPGGLAPGGSLELDAARGEGYCLDASQQSSHVAVSGGPLRAEPSGYTRIYFQAADLQGAADIGLTASLSVWLRPAWRLP